MLKNFKYQPIRHKKIFEKVPVLINILTACTVSKIENGRRESSLAAVNKITKLIKELVHPGENFPEEVNLEYRNHLRVSKAY